MEPACHILRVLHMYMREQDPLLLPSHSVHTIMPYWLRKRDFPRLNTGQVYRVHVIYIIYILFYKDVSIVIFTIDAKLHKFPYLRKKQGIKWQKSRAVLRFFHKILTNIAKNSGYLAAMLLCH